MKQLPERPSLEFLRKEAKQLLALVRSGDPDAKTRLAAVTDSNKPSLHHAQLALAREYGFPSWRDLASKTRSTLTDQFLTVVTDERWDRGETMPLPPQTARMGNIWVAAACGDIESLEHLVKKDRNLVKAKGGPTQSTPLLYLCFSRLNRVAPRDFAECAEYLLQNGADANDFFISPDYPDYPFPVLFGAAGVVNNPELVTVLLAHGADVNDNESLYHSTESRNHDCLRLLLAAKPKFKGSNAIFRMLDFEDVEGLKLFIEAGAEMDDYTLEDGPLNHAIRRNRGKEHIQLLLEAGADPNRPSKEGWPPYILALRSANREAADFLREKGYATDTDPRDEYIAACIDLDFDRARKSGLTPADLRPEDLDSVVEAAFNERNDFVFGMVDLGYPVDHGSVHFGQTALHGAAWKGNAPLVELLLSHGARTDLVERQFNATAIGWAEHGKLNSHDSDGNTLNPNADYDRVFELLGISNP
jgi:ankyrin repeat protein